MSGRKVRESDPDHEMLLQDPSDSMYMIAIPLAIQSPMPSPKHQTIHTASEKKG